MAITYKFLPESGEFDVVSLINDAYEMGIVPSILSAWVNEVSWDDRETPSPLYCSSK